MASSGSPLVTLVLTGHRQETSIREAIEGAFAQTYQPLEIVLSDDASSDRTFKIMQDMTAAYCGPHRVVLNRNVKNLGLVLHLDRIMEIASGDFIVQSHGDDISEAGRVAALVRVWKASNRKALLVHSANSIIDREGRRIGERRPYLRIDALRPINIIRDPSLVLGATCGWDRRVFDEFGPLGPDLISEDTILPFRAAILGDIGYVDEVLVRRRVGGVSWHPRNNTPDEVLYGITLRVIRWRLQNCHHILTRFADWNYPDKKAVEEICRARIPRYELRIALADAPRGVRRLKFLPHAIALSLRFRQFWPLADALKYQFEAAYKIYWRFRRGAPVRVEPASRTGSAWDADSEKAVVQPRN